MRPRDLSILLGTFALVGAAGLIWWSAETQAQDMPPGVTSATEPANPEPSEGTAHRGDPVAATSAEFRPSTTSVAVTDAPAKARSSAGMGTTGVIRGDIGLAVSVLDRIQSITVIVEEARRAVVNGHYAPPQRKYVNVQRGEGTPTFEVRMPFSDYPYVVSVYSPGLNGSSRTLTLDADHAVVDDVRLDITPGSPFSVLVRDQDAAPFPDLDVVLVAVGDPAGRPTRKATTDNYGSTVFDDLLAGDYQLTINSAGQPLIEPETIAVQPGLRSYGTKVQGQGHQVTVPRGVPVHLLVHDTAGYGIAEAKVTATQLDSVRLKTVPGVTDGAGRADYPHMLPGRWQFTVEKDGFARVDRPLTITANQEPQQLDVRLLPTRR